MAYFLRKFNSQEEADQHQQTVKQQREAKLLADLEQTRKEYRDIIASCPIMAAREARDKREQYERYVRGELNMELIRQWGDDYKYLKMGQDYPYPLENYIREEELAIIAKHGSQENYKKWVIAEAMRALSK